jgi:hypothetical protein
VLNKLYLFARHYICLLEHTPTYTVGLRDQSYTPEMEEKLRSLGADFQRFLSSSICINSFLELNAVD